MDQTGHLLHEATILYARANSTSTSNADTASRPAIYKPIGICLATASGLFIGVSFVLKKVGLLKANVKYNEEAGEGYSYLKNGYWWGGMILMIIGEFCNLGAYAFVDAILVTPLGALSVVITTVLSAIFLKERLSMVGKVGCFLCVIGAVIIGINAPSQSSVADIQEMKNYVIAPGFLSYAGVIILGCTFVAFWAGPRYGKKSMLVYLTICSLIGGLSVVATQGLGAAIVAQAAGTQQFNQWFLYVLLVFVVATLLTEIIFLNKALNLFNAALVTPTYYVYFTTATIITSAILFRGFKGTVDQIITVVMGFFVICSGVILLQLSKSAKDVPDTAIFTGDLDQMRTIAEQEQPESEPKADAIRGTAAIIRRMSQSRQKMELDEAKRIQEEKQKDLEPIGEDEQFEWDGLRRRRTTYGSGRSNTVTSRPRTHETAHPPLGMSRFPEYDEDAEIDRPTTGGSQLSSNFMGSFRARTMSVLGQHGHHGQRNRNASHTTEDSRSPMHPVPLTEIQVPKSEMTPTEAFYTPPPAGDAQDHTFGLPSGLRDHNTEYRGASGIAGGDGATSQAHIKFQADIADNRDHLSRPQSNSARRQFSFQNVFKHGRHASQDDSHDDHHTTSPTASRAHHFPGLGSRQASQHKAPTVSATEEERLGLVKGDTNLGLPRYEEEDSSSEGWEMEGKEVEADVPRSPDDEDTEMYRRQRDKFYRKGSGSGGGGGGGGGAFV